MCHDPNKACENPVFRIQILEVRIRDDAMEADDKLAVIADDLTGACDTACQFALYGFRPEVGHASACGAPQPKFLVCNSESRKDDAGAAQQKIFDIASALLQAHYQAFYKKLDSTLK